MEILSMKPWRIQEVKKFAVRAQIKNSRSQELNACCWQVNAAFMAVSLGLNMVALPKVAVATLLVFKSFQCIISAGVETIIGTVTLAHVHNHTPCHSPVPSPLSALCALHTTPHLTTVRHKPSSEVETRYPYESVCIVSRASWVLHPSPTPDTDPWGNLLFTPLRILARQPTLPDP